MRRGKIIVLVMVFLAVALGFMLGMFVVTDVCTTLISATSQTLTKLQDSHDDDDHGSPYKPPPSSPAITWSTPAPTVTHTSIRNPPIPSSTPTPLPVPSDPIHIPLPPDLSSRCPLAVHNKTYHFEFNDLTEFSLYELAHLNSLASIRTTGKITLVAGPSDQNTTISITVSTHATSDSLLRRVKYSSTANQLSLDVDDELFPIPIPHFGHDTPCILIYVTVAIAPGSGLDNLHIHASDLEVELTSGLSLSVSETTNMTASHAHVASMAADTFIPRRLYIDVSSGSVTGSFPLLDLLHITARSGSVDIDVIPKPADPNSPTPAVLYVGAASGSVAVRYPTTEADLHARDYRVTVTAQSGSITGQYIHGSQTQLTTHSGHIDALVTPLGVSDVVSFLRTESRSGYTKLELLAPLVRPDCLRHMRSRHDVASGGIKLVYPHLWEGTIAAETTNGHVRVDGDGVEDKSVVRQGAREVVTARKGSGDGIVEIQDRSGSIDLWFPPL